MSVGLFSQHPISVVIIAQNEERRIGDCIDSVRALTDDIIVIDSGSTDRTREVCIERGALVIHHAWAGYSQQKNFGNSLAKHDWILSLDADERVSTKLADNIRREFASLPSCDAYTFRFRSFFEGKPVRFGAWNPETHTRLFDRRKFSWNRDDVHEGLRGIGECSVGTLDGVVLHFTVESRQQLAAKTEHYTSLFAEKAPRDRKQISWRKVWLNPAWRFFRDYLARLGFLDGTTGWKIACEGARYTHLKYSKIAKATGGYRPPNWIGLGSAAAALALAGYTLQLHVTPKSAQNQHAHLEQKAPQPTRPEASQLAAYDDNYEDAGLVLPVDDDGVA